MAVTFGAGGLVAVNAAGGVDSTTVLTDPVRVLDSRDPVNVGLPGPFESQSPQKLKVTGSIPTTTGTKTVVPTGATGVLLNVTAVAPEADGFISIRPGDATGLPTTSSLNVTVGGVLANAVLVALPTSGTNAGQIDITWDAYGFLEPRTDILIDVVGYTSSSKLDALQAAIDTKANSADVYTKTQIDASVANTLKSGGRVTTSATLATNWVQFGLVPTVVSTGTGGYQLTFPGLLPGCTGSGGANPAKFPNASITGYGVIATLSGAGTSCPSGNISLSVSTRNLTTQVAQNGQFDFQIYTDYQIPLGAALVAEGPQITCTVQGDSEPVCS
ncbi:MAG TPA: hypothetical protein VMW33_14355 [Ilumatobacteraceae bacterium]|nr:hypothetical protein [Ilumatobacteraceae bacterium]